MCSSATFLWHIFSAFSRSHVLPLWIQEVKECRPNRPIFIVRGFTIVAVDNNILRRFILERFTDEY